jgi:predicted component of type VI protein secretion system
MVKWPPSRILSWAQSLGVSVGRLIEEILNSKKHPEQGYRSSMGIIRLEKKYGRQRLDKACHRALELGVHSYSFVSNMLKNNMDKLIANDSIDKKELCTKVKESNTRGREYYH